MLEIKFNKSFFAGIIHAPESSMRYGLLRHINDLTGCVTWQPVIVVKGISKYVYDIENATFRRFGGENFTLYTNSVTVTKSKHRYAFCLNGEIKVNAELADFYRNYLTRVANPDLYQH